MKLNAKKSLGQHFLKSLAIVNKMVSAGNITGRDVVVEIGPGTGVLTKALLRKAKKVIAIEKDRDLIDKLSERFTEELASEKLILLEGDALEINIDQIIQGESYKIIANIPYYITGALLRTFLEQTTQPQLLVFLMQKEVAVRIMARDNKESILSLSVQLYGNPVYIQKVSPKAFSPAPNVDSAILLIKEIGRKHLATKKEEDAFFSLVKTGFQHKRKTLLKNLSLEYDRSDLEKIFLQCEIPQNTRAEDVSFQQWINMTKKFAGL